MAINNTLANRVFLAFKDMTYALHYLQGYKALEEYYPDKNTVEYVDAVQAILIAVVVTYSRPFKKSYSMPHADPFLEPDQIGLFEGYPELEAIHNRVITQRDQAIAHADWVHHSTGVIDANVEINRVIRQSPRPRFLGDITAEELLRLVNHVLHKCRNKAYELDMLNRSAPQP